MNANEIDPRGWENKQLKVTARLAAWSLASGATWAFAVLGAQFLWDGNRAVSGLAIAVNVIVGIVLLRVNRDYLRSLDEMQQRVHLESMGLALTIGLEAILVYFALALTKVIEIRADFALFAIVPLMCLTHLGGVIYGNFWKYR